ncbi:MAG: hypothetical protein NUW02_02975, partial [Candidatus Campbellbacteria bacterium]|nr:hypothetical protein [Candidatus Campbellbacteria bacterium]
TLSKGYFFATSSADYWKSVNNFFSTTSADYLATQRNFFSTSSANNFINSSTTIAAAGNAIQGQVLMWNGTAWVAAATSSPWVVSGANIYYPSGLVAGNVGIGTSSPYAKFSIHANNNDGSETLFSVATSTLTSTTTAFTVLKTGRVDILPDNVTDGTDLMKLGGAGHYFSQQAGPSLLIARSTSGGAPLFWINSRSTPKISTLAAGIFGWSATGAFSETLDTALARLSAGVIGVTDGAGAGGALYANYFNATSTNATSTFAGTLSLTGRLADSSGTGGASGMVLQTNGTGVVWVATSSLNITGAADGSFSTTSADYYVVSSSTIAHASGVTSGNVLQWNGSAWISVATTTLGIIAAGDGTFSTTSADYWKTVTDFFSTTSVDYWQTVRNFFSTSSANAFINASSTIAAASGVTSGNVLQWNGSKWVSVATTTLGIIAVGDGTFSTTSADYWQTVRNFFSTTSVDYWQTVRNFFSTSSANTFVNSSSTIAHVGNAVTGNVISWNGSAWISAATSTFKILADDITLGATNLFYTDTRVATYINASSTIANPSGITSGNLIQWNGTKWVSVATSTLNITAVGDGTFSTTSADYYIGASSTIAHAGNAITGNVISWNGSAWISAATSTFKILADDITLGATNLFYTDTRVATYINASSTIANPSGITSGNLISWNGSKWVSVATSTLNIIGAADGAFSTTSADYYITASSTIASAGNATPGQVLMWSAGAWIAAATSSAGGGVVYRLHTIRVQQLRQRQRHLL